MKINGKWYFNEVLSGVNDFSELVKYSSNNQEYVSITVEYVGEDTPNLVYTHTTDADTPYWGNNWDMGEAYRTIDFGAAYQEVSDDFYNWLTANAVQLSNPIPMTHPKGIRLLTKGHKLSKDLEVVPTFAAAETVDIQIDDETAGRIDILLIGEDGKIKLRPSDYYSATYKVVKDSFAVLQSDTLATVYYKDNTDTPIEPFVQYTEDSSKITIFQVSESGHMMITM